MKGAGHTSLYITILKNNTQPHPRGTQKVYLKIIKAFCCECRNVSRHPKITFLFCARGKNKWQNKLVFTQKITNKQLCCLQNLLLLAWVHKICQDIQCEFFVNNCSSHADKAISLYCITEKNSLNSFQLYSI